MRISKRQIGYFLIVLIFATFLTTFQLPYYIYKPGSADPLTSIVEVEEGHVSEGEMHLVTVSGGQATPLQYLWAKASSFYDVLPLEDVRPKGVSREDYLHAQLQMMENSQDASVVVAYEAAGKEVNFISHGVRVISVEEGMPAENLLKENDLIIRIDHEEIEESDDLIDYITNKEEGDEVTIEYLREDENKEAKVMLKSFENPQGEMQIGLGIRLITEQSLNVHPEIKFSSGNIGGPSAGLMFALEIYNQLVEEDITKGYQVIGSGELNFAGKVSAIGQVDKKVVAAHKAGCEIFFAPYEEGKTNSNYEIAMETAKEIGTDMEIVPIDTFEEALDYLEKLDPKR